MMHNHTSGIAIPSPDDLHTMYQMDSIGNNNNDTKFIIKGGNKWVSFEIYNSAKFKFFFENVLLKYPGEDYSTKFANFKDAFCENILHYEEDMPIEYLKDFSCIQLMAEYFNDHGLKIAYAFDDENELESFNWSYGNTEIDGAYRFTNCFFN